MGIERSSGNWCERCVHLFVNVFICLAVVMTTVSATKVDSVQVPRNTGPDHDRIVVCYVASWATYRPNRGSFTLDDVDPTLCTHLVYAFAGLDIAKNTIKSMDPYNDLEEDYGKGSYKKMTAMRQQNPHLKVTIAIGGWNEGSANYSLLASSPQRRKVFVQSVTDFIRKYNFDGLDLDWEFPGKRGGKPEDKVNFISLVKELRTAFDKHGWLLTAALGAGIDTIDIAYDVKPLGQYLDFLHVMCYDYHGAWDKKTGSNTPFLSQPDKFSVEDSVEYLLQMGAPPHKLVLGLSMYGRTFVMEGEENKNAKALGFPAKEKGFQGPYTREDGFLGYNEICLELEAEDSTWEEYWDDNTDTPFAVQGNKVISFDNPKSIREKVNYAVTKDLAGVMIWAMDNDDFRGECSKKSKSNYPLLRSINKAVIDSTEGIKQRAADKEREEKQKISKSSAITRTVTSISYIITLSVSFVFAVVAGTMFGL